MSLVDSGSNVIVSSSIGYWSVQMWECVCRWLTLVVMLLLVVVVLDIGQFKCGSVCRWLTLVVMLLLVVVLDIGQFKCGSVCVAG